MSPGQIYDFGVYIGSPAPYSVHIGELYANPVRPSTSEVVLYIEVVNVQSIVQDLRIVSA